MQEPNEGGENQSPQDRSEVTTGAARLGAALLNTSTDPLTQIPDHTGGLASLAEPEASSRLSLHYTGTEQPQRDAAADAADGQPPDAVASQPISARLTRSTRARTSQVASSVARGGSALPPPRQQTEHGTFVDGTPHRRRRSRLIDT